jgi:DNA polymerase-3 subunit beta
MTKNSSATSSSTATVGDEQRRSSAMTFTANKRVLFEALQSVSRAVAPRTTLPILSNVLLETQGDQLHLVATDLEMSLECRFPVQEAQPGAVTLPARVLSEVVGSLPDANVTLATDDRHVLTLTCGKSCYSIHGLPADEFPQPPEVTGEVAFEMAQTDLRRMIRRTALAASADETRAVLTGMLLAWDGKTLKLVATDTHRLAVDNLGVEGKAAQPVEVIVPARALRELERGLSGADEEARVRVQVGENQIQFTFGQFSLVSRLIEGQFPNYERVIPQDTDKELAVDREELLSALRRAAIVARAEANKVVFRTQDSALTVEAESAEVGRAHEELAAEYQGEPIEIAFNADYLITVLAETDAERVTMSMTGPLNPGLLRLAGDESYFYVVMPMQLM